MRPADYQKALEAARAEIQQVLSQRTQLDERLGQLQKTVEALAALVEGVPESYAEALSAERFFFSSGIGISDAIRRILFRSQSPMSPVGVRNELIAMGFSLAEYANPMAVIHNTLKRLMQQDEIIGVRDRSEQVVAYARRTVPPPPGLDPIPEPPVTMKQFGEK